MGLIEQAEQVRNEAAAAFDALPLPARVMAGPVVSIVEKLGAALVEMAREIETLKGEKNGKD